MKEFIPIEPLLAFEPPHQEPWARVATDEAKASGTYVHLGDPYAPNEMVLTYESAAKLHEWLGRALGLRS